MNQPFIVILTSVQYLVLWCVDVTRALFALRSVVLQRYVANHESARCVPCNGTFFTHAMGMGPMHERSPYTEISEHR